MADDVPNDTPASTGNFEIDYAELCRKAGLKPLPVRKLPFPLPPIPLPSERVSTAPTSTCTPQEVVPVMVEKIEFENQPPEVIPEPPSSAQQAKRPANADASKKNVTNPNPPISDKTKNRAPVTKGQNATGVPPPTPPQPEQNSKTVVQQLTQYKLQPTIFLEASPNDPDEVYKLQIRGWKLSTSMLDVLVSCLSGLPTITSVSFWNCAFTESDIASMVKLASLPHLTRLHLDYNSNTCEQLYTALIRSEDSTIRFLSLRGNNLNDDNAVALANSLKFNQELVALDLWDNKIGKLGAEAFAEALKVNSTITSLSLGRNPVGDDGVLAIAKAISKYPITQNDLSERKRFLFELQKRHEEHVRRLERAANRSKSEETINKKEASASVNKKPAPASAKPTPAPAKKDDKAAGKDSKQASPKKQDPKAAASAAGKDKDKKAPVQSSVKPGLKKKEDGKEDGEEGVETVTHVPAPDAPFERNGRMYLWGNRTLSHLSLSSTGVSDYGLRVLLEAVQEQDIAVAELGADIGRGLLAINLSGNKPEQQQSEFATNLLRVLSSRTSFAAQAQAIESN